MAARFSLRASLAIVGVLALLAAACGGSDDDATSDADQPTASAAPTATAADEPTSAPEPEAPDTPVDAARIVEDFVGESDGGVSVLLVNDGAVTSIASGVADSTGRLIEPDDGFRVGSISKPFVATMVLQLVDEGAVALDDRLGDHLDTTVGADATIEALLSHQSGIPNYTDQPDFFPETLAARDRALTPDDILAYVDDVDAGQADSFAYSNTNYVLLGALIEALDGRDLSASLAARITEPLGMDGTYFETADRPSDGVAGWSSGVLAGDAAEDYTSIATGAWAAGALVSTTADLATFLDALRTAELVSPASLDAMTDTSTTGYGLGVFQVSFGPGQIGFGHNGGIPGYTSTMGIASETGDTIVVLTNNDRLIADLLAQQLLG